MSAIQAREDERKQINRELHDELGQGLMTLRLSVGMLLKDAEEPTKSRAQEALNVVDKTIEGLRRIIRRFSPKALEDLGLLQAIRREAASLSQQTGMTAHLTLPEELASMDREVEIAIYRSVQEALHNISKHSRAKNFAVAVEDSRQRIAVRVSDDGVGLLPTVVDSSETFGIAGMRERVQEVGGTLLIESLPTGGTRIEIEIPVANAGLRTMRNRIRNMKAKAS